MNSHYNLIADDRFFLSILDELLKTHKNEYVIIHDAKIVGFFKKREDAANYAISNFTYGEYLISHIIKQEDAPKFVSFRYAYI